MVKNSPTSAGDPGDTGSIPGEGNGNPLQYAFLVNPTDRGAWQAAVYGVAEGRTRLSNQAHRKPPLFLTSPLDALLQCIHLHMGQGWDSDTCFLFIEAPSESAFA